MKHRILVVDDSSSDVELLLVVLRSIRPALDTYVASDGQEALECLLEPSDSPPRLPGPLSLVLLDIKMPKVDGLQALTALKSDPRTKMIPVVMFTSSYEERDIERAYVAGANGYVVKPVDFDDYRNVLTKIAAYWLDANRQPGANASQQPGESSGFVVFTCHDLPKPGAENT